MLSGKNGSGKTRILNAIRDAIEYGKNLSSQDSRHDGDYNIYLESLKKDISRNELLLIDESSEQRISIINNIINASKKELSENANIKFAKGISAKTINLVEIVPQTNFNFTDPRETTEKNINEIRGKIENVFEDENKTADALIRIKISSDDFVVAENPNSKLNTDEKEDALRQYRAIRKTVNELVGASLSHSERLDPILDNLHLSDGAERLSNGQKRLLDFSTTNDSVYASQEATLLLMDEPELFIHPAALSMMIDRIVELYPNMQMIIATHSVPLIAHLGFEKIWWVEDGKVSYAGKDVGGVLESLLGGHENIEKLQELTLEPARLAAISFAAQCLLPPSVVSQEGRDPQANQVSISLSKLYNRRDGKIRVLDWGAGKCRLLACLNEELRGVFEESIDYIGYEPNDDHNTIANSIIQQIYQNHEGRLMNKLSELADSEGMNSFDAVILCNVMHEISPTTWKNLFSRIQNFLATDGYLIIVEDNHIPNGEIAHSEGFIISDGRALQSLFELNELPENIQPEDKKYEKRLFAHIIPAEKLVCNASSIRAALIWIRDQSLQKISEIRSKSEPDYHDGLLHGLYAMQFVNSSIALDKI